MAEERRVIIDVEVKADETAKRLAEVKKGIAELKAEQRDLQKQIAAGADITGELSMRYAENAAQLRQMAAEEKMYTAQLNISTQGNRQYGDSLVEMSALLAQLKAEYRGMTEEQRKSAEGQALQEQIAGLDAQMKEADATLGDFQRNVGNYASALGGSNQVVVKAAQLFAGGFRSGIAQATTAVKAFGKTLFTTPLGWITAAVGAVVQVFKQLQDAFRRNDDASAAMSAAMARLQPVVTAIKEAFSALASVVARVVGGVMEVASAVIGFLVPSFKTASEAAAEQVRRMDQLEEKERSYTKASAERARDRARLEDEARNSEKLTAEERLRLLEQSRRLAEEDLKERKAIAKEKYEVLLQEQKETNDYSDAMKNRLAEAYAAMLQTETEFITGTRRLNAQMKSNREEIERDAKQKAEAARKRWQEVRKAREEAARTEREELRKLEDLTIAAISDMYAREEAETRAAYTRQVEDIQRRLQTEKNLTEETRKALNQQIVLLEERKEAEIKAIRDKAGEDAIQAEIDRQRANLEAFESLQREQQDIVRAQYEHTMQAYVNNLERQLLAAGDNARLQAEATLKAAQDEAQALLNMNAETQAALFENYDQYTAAKLAAEKRVRDAQKQTSEALRQQVEQIGATMQAVTGSISDLFEAAAGESEAYEKFKKAMAIVDATISLATTIAAATTASTQGDPYTMAIRIATNVAAVTAQFAAVIKAIKAATIPSAGSFAEGGVVPGTAYEGDTLTARVSSGEMILNRRQQAELWEMLRDGAAGSGIDYSRMAAAMREAAASIPAPVMDYREFVRFRDRVATIENLTTR